MGKKLATIVLSLNKIKLNISRMKQKKLQIGLRIFYIHEHIYLLMYNFKTLKQDFDDLNSPSRGRCRGIETEDVANQPLPMI